MSNPLVRTSAGGVFEYVLLCGRCRVCGCTELEPCTEGEGSCCMWVDAAHTLCSSTRCVAAVPMDELDTLILA